MHVRVGTSLLVALFLAGSGHADKRKPPPPAADVESPAERDRREAQVAVQEAMRHYDLGEYAPALDGFKRAYLKFESSKILYNIAKCQQRLGDLEAAAGSYRSYLQFPDVSDRPQTEAIIADLDRQIAARKSAALTQPNPAADDAERRRRRNLAIGLSVGGVVLVGVIVGLAVGLSGPATTSGSLGAFAGTQ